MTAYQRKQLALLERIAVALEAAGAAAARQYSDAPAAIRMRRMRATRREQSVTPVTRPAPFSEAKRRERSVTSVTPPAALSSSSLRSEDREKLGALRVPPGFLVRVYCTFGAAHRACTGSTWYGRGQVPPEEIRHAKRLHQVVDGDVRKASAAIARFARLWRDDQFTRRLGFTFRTLLWTHNKIQEQRNGLHVSAPTPRRIPPAALLEEKRPLSAAPARVVEMPATPKGNASVRELLAQLTRHGAPGLKH